MPHALILLMVVAQAAPGHDANPVFRELVTAGLAVGSTRVRLPEPTLPDGNDAEAGSAAIRQVAGDDRAARELVRDSVTAPFILKSRDVPADGAVIRVADLWFVVHARLEAIDPQNVARQSADKSVEAGNMRFESKLLAGDDLREHNVPVLPAFEGRQEWFTHQTGRLLDRIAVDATDRVVVTRTPDSLLLATRTDPTFDRDGRSPNRWRAIARQGPAESEGPARPYSGGMSYVKITRLSSHPGALFVEAHFAFVEPLEWFGGNPILRSKIGVIAQDQIRRLRREIAKIDPVK